jgi:hypothetical protein
MANLKFEFDRNYNLFKHVESNVYELQEQGLHGNCKRVKVELDSRGCLNVINHMDIDNSGHLRLRRNGKKIKVHRHVWQLARNRVILDGYNVNHLCDNPKCVNPEHIYMGTQADNGLDMTEEGKAKRVIIFLNN